jgi:dihydropteroate synthase
MRRLPRILGILNVTPDSFSDGGRFADCGAAVAAGAQLMAEGAAAVDVGGESTRPGAAPVPAEAEMRRVLPVVEALAKAGVPVSVDTRRAAVMRAALAAGASMLNDVTALTGDPDSLAVAAASSADLVLMHMAGIPQTMQDAPHYADPVGEVARYLEQRVQACIAAGIDRRRLIVDPGIGFGKTAAHNLALLRDLEALQAIGVDVMLGASRKSVIADVAGPAAPLARLGGSLALALRAAEAGLAWIRVHDVAATRQALLLWAAASPPAA